jgi:hypothetical protein
VLATDAELMVEAGVVAVISIDRGTGLDGSSDSAREVAFGSASPVEEPERCRDALSASASERICSEAICAAARCLVGLRSTKGAKRAGMRARFLRFGTVEGDAAAGASTGSCDSFGTIVLVLMVEVPVGGASTGSSIGSSMLSHASRFTVTCSDEPTAATESEEAEGIAADTLPAVVAGTAGVAGGGSDAVDDGAPVVGVSPMELRMLTVAGSTGGRAAGTNTAASFRTSEASNSGSGGGSAEAGAGGSAETGGGT